MTLYSPLADLGHGTAHVKTMQPEQVIAFTDIQNALRAADKDSVNGAIWVVLSALTGVVGDDTRLYLEAWLDATKSIDQRDLSNCCDGIGYIHVT